MRAIQHLAGAARNCPKVLTVKCADGNDRAESRSSGGPYAERTRDNARRIRDARFVQRCVVRLQCALRLAACTA